MLTLYVHAVKSLCNKSCDFCITKRQIKDNSSYPELLKPENLLNNYPITDLERIEITGDGELTLKPYQCTFINIFKKHFKNLLNNYPITNLERIEITGGGEPTLNPYLCSLINLFKKIFIGVPIHMCTNGIALIPDLYVDRITISTSLSELINGYHLPIVVVDAIKFYSNYAKNVRVRIYCNDSELYISKLDILSLYQISLSFPNLSFVFGKDFSDLSSLHGRIESYISAESLELYKTMCEKNIIKIDENSKKCLEHPIIYTDGKFYKNWNKFIKEDNKQETYGYHIDSIKKGIYGETSKIFEEVDEFKDAEKQNNKIMMLVELSDIIGAIKGYLDNYHKSISITDLICMSETTERAFKNGKRSN